MPRLTETDGLTDLQRDILGAVREFVNAEIIPVAGELDRTDTYPERIVAGLRELGVFGLTIDPSYGGLGESLLTYALVAEEIARGWMSISGIINTHFIVAYLISRHGTAEQRAAFLPPDGYRGDPGGLLHVRTGPGVGRGRHPDRGPARRGRLRDQRAEDVDHQRRVRQPGGAAGPDAF
jgi:alkylation response protein AidB-like acyl-CoA dehydrogenase